MKYFIFLFPALMLSCMSSDPDDLASEFCECFESGEGQGDSPEVYQCINTVREDFREELKGLHGEGRRAFLIQFHRDLDENIPEHAQGSESLDYLMAWLDEEYSLQAVAGGFGGTITICDCWSRTDELVQMMMDQEKTYTREDIKRVQNQVEGDCSDFLKMEDEQLLEALADCDAQEDGTGNDDLGLPSFEDL